VAVLRTFLDECPGPTVVRGEGCYLWTKDGRRLFDTTGGLTSHCILGWSHPPIVSAVEQQLRRISHIDYKGFVDENREELSDLLLSKSENGLNRVYFSGNSGGEACEAAMKLSFQSHYDSGDQGRHWFISRKQSYHGSSTDALSLGDRPNLDFFAPLLPTNRFKIAEHNVYRESHQGETPDEYAKRSAGELEEAIVRIGPEKVCAFVAETIGGGLVGYVPPAGKYWKYVRDICTQYGVHLILDEVICGTGTTGKVYCCDWDGITPDFLFLGKTLASGYSPLSIVLTTAEVERAIASGQGRIQHSTTHQGHTLGVAAALAVQKIIHSDGFLAEVNATGKFIVSEIQRELAEHEFFRNIRGRGMRLAVEYSCDQMNQFGRCLTNALESRHGILIDGKWHRITLSPMLNTPHNLIEEFVDKFCREFKRVAASWSTTCRSLDEDTSDPQRR